MIFIERNNDDLFIEGDYEQFIMLPYAERIENGVVINLKIGRYYTYKMMGEPSKLYNIYKLNGRYEVKHLAKNIQNDKAYYIFYLDEIKNNVL